MEQIKDKIGLSIEDLRLAASVMMCIVNVTLLKGTDVVIKEITEACYINPHFGKNDDPKYKQASLDFYNAILTILTALNKEEKKATDMFESVDNN